MTCGQLREELLLLLKCSMVQFSVVVEMSGFDVSVVTRGPCDSHAVIIWDKWLAVDV